jgi:hypothetical protein
MAIPRMPALYNMQGELISTFTGEFKPIMQEFQALISFRLMDHDFILAPATNHVTGMPPAAFQLFLIPEAGAEEADSIAVFPERGLGKFQWFLCCTMQLMFRKTRL